MPRKSSFGYIDPNKPVGFGEGAARPTGATTPEVIHHVLKIPGYHCTRRSFAVASAKSDEVDGGRTVKNAYNRYNLKIGTLSPKAMPALTSQINTIKGNPGKFPSETGRATRCAPADTQQFIGSLSKEETGG